MSVLLCSLGDVLHLSGVDLISGTPVLDIKPYIPEYDSPVTHTTLSTELQHQQEVPSDTPDALEEVEPAEPEGLENSYVSSRLEAEERLSDVGEFSAESDVPGVLGDVREFLLQGAPCSQGGAEDKQTDEEEEESCESNSSVASWIRKPPVRNLSVRFTPTAERQLADFLPPHCSGLSHTSWRFISNNQTKFNK